MPGFAAVRRPTKLRFIQFRWTSVCQSFASHCGKLTKMCHSTFKRSSMSVIAKADTNSTSITNTSPIHHSSEPTPAGPTRSSAKPATASAASGGVDFAVRQVFCLSILAPLHSFFVCFWLRAGLTWPVSCFCLPFVSGAAKMNRPALAFLCLIAVFDLPAFAQPDPLLDVAGDPLPAGAIARLGTTRYRLRGWHQGVFFSPDGNTVICKGEESVIRAFEVASGKVVWEFKDADLTNWTADQSPDGTTLAVLGYQKTGERLPTPALRVYDLPTRKPLWTIPVSSDYSSSLRVRFFPNGKTVVTTTAHEIRFWDARTGIELLRQKAELPYGGFEISRDGKWICYGYSDLFLWDWESGAEPRKIEGAGIGGSGLFFFGPDRKSVVV